MAEAAGLPSVTLDLERHLAALVKRRGTLEAERELRNDVLEAHVRAIDIVRAKDQHAIEKFAAAASRATVPSG